MKRIKKLFIVSIVLATSIGISATASADYKPCPQSYEIQKATLYETKRIAPGLFFIFNSIYEVNGYTQLQSIWKVTVHGINAKDQEKAKIFATEALKTVEGPTNPIGGICNYKSSDGRTVTARDRDYY